MIEAYIYLSLLELGLKNPLEEQVTAGSKGGLKIPPDEEPIAGDSVIGFECPEEAKVPGSEDILCN